jgi:hypothetical protein
MADPEIIKNGLLYYLLTSFAFIVALSWSSAISTLFDNYFPDKNKSIFSRFLYAIILTFVLILISIYLNRPIPQTSLATPKK